MYILYINLKLYEDNTNNFFFDFYLEIYEDNVFNFIFINEHLLFNVILCK